MRTEVTIPFAFDTAPIEQMLQNEGEKIALKMVKDMVTEKVISSLPAAGYGGYGYSTGKPKSLDDVDWRGAVNNVIRDILESHTDEIIDEAAMLMAERASRKRTWRETLAAVKEETDAD